MQGNLLDSALAERDRERRRLDELRPVTDDREDFHALDLDRCARLVHNLWPSSHCGLRRKNNESTVCRWRSTIAAARSPGA